MSVALCILTDHCAVVLETVYVQTQAIIVLIIMMMIMVMIMMMMMMMVLLLMRWCGIGGVGDVLW